MAQRYHHESLAAVNRGVDLHGICLFPAVDMADWHTGEWLHMGIADVEELPSGALMRTPFPPYVQRAAHWQQRLNRVTELDDDPVRQAREFRRHPRRGERASADGGRRLELRRHGAALAAIGTSRVDSTNRTSAAPLP